MLAVVGIFILANVIGGFIKMAIPDHSFGVFVSYTFALGATIIFALWLRGRRLGGRIDLPFRLKRTNPSLVLWGLILVFATSTVLEPLLALFPDDFMKLLDSAVGSGFWAVVTTVVCAPVLEEMLFRGIIQESCTRQFGGVRGVIAAAAIFGVIHFIPQQVINAFFIGIILGYIYIRTKSLTPVILIHAFNNAVAFLMMKVFPAPADGSTVYLRHVIGNDTFYWVLYGMLALLVLISGAFVFRYLKQEKPVRP